MANHILIGLGGTGGKILRGMRKRIYEEFGTNEPDCPTHIEFIYVDSDEADLNDKGSWTYMGNPVHLAAYQKVNIHGMSGGILNNLNAYPGIRSFISNADREQMRNDAVTGIIDTGIGGQRRRFGRMLMANNVVNDSLNGFSAVLRQRIINFTHANAGEGTITFHIAAGLAGGTGSGSIVDTIAQLHKIVEPMGRAFEIFLYLYVPEIMVTERENAGFYHANGYAALQEINAISLGAYRPTDIAGDIDPATGLVKRLVESRNVPPFKMAYLFSDRNEMDMVLDKKTKLPMAVADFLFNRTFRHESSKDSHMEKLVNMENNPGAPETDEEGNRVHDCKFMTFGIVRIVYPESEIKAYSSDKCSVSQLQGLINNQWVDGSGFVVETDESAGNGINIEVRSPQFQEGMMLDIEHLTLQRPIADYPGTEDYQSYKEYWSNFCTFFADDVAETEGLDNHRGWVALFNEICDNEYNNNFRNLGVNRYFANYRQQNEVRRFAAVICNNIERKIFDEWVNGRHGERQKMSLQKAALYIRELEQSTRERIPMVDTQKIDLVNFRNERQARASECESKLNGKSLFGRRETFNNYAACNSDILYCNTMLEACDFARQIMTAIVNRLNEMHRSVLLLINMFNNAIAEAAQRAEASCRPSNRNVGGEVQTVDKRFDPVVVESNVHDVLIVDETFQNQLKNNILAKFNNLANAAGRPTLFNSLYNALGGRLNDVHAAADEVDNVNDLLDVIRETNRDNISNRLNALAKEDDDRKVLGVNILERIKRECPTDIQLENFIKDNIYNKVCCFLQFNQAQLGIGDKKSMPGIQVVLPEYSDPTNFRNRFIIQLQKQFGDITFTMPESVATSKKENEIVVIMMKSGFPLRFVQNLGYLKQQYDNLVSVHNPLSELNKVLLHTESLPASELPSLFDEDPAERRKRMTLVAIKLHSIPGLIEQGVDPKSGDPVNIVVVGHGFDAQDIVVGKNAIATATHLCDNKEVRKLLTNFVDKHIAGNYRSSSDKNKLMKQIEDMICTDVLKACGNNRLAPEFKEYVDIAKDYFNTLN